MEENFVPKQENDFVFSKAVKAGKRIYYFDARRTRNSNDLFMTITESKKLLSGTPENPTFSFAKQKLTIYKEDLRNFADALNEITSFLEQALENETPDNQSIRRERNYTQEKTQFRKPYVKPAIRSEQTTEYQPQPEPKAEEGKPKSSFFGKIFGSGDKKQPAKENIDKYFEDINFEV